MNQLLIAISIVLVIAIGIGAKVWACGELFPDANLAACLFWR